MRIAYAPPADLAVFGGDADNYAWPRHCADFALLRACPPRAGVSRRRKKERGRSRNVRYVAPDGGAAAYDAGNVPYEPATWLRCADDGVADGDFVFLLGFPSTTSRYAPTVSTSTSRCTPKTSDSERYFDQTSRSRVEMCTGPRISPNRRNLSEILGFKDSGERTSRSR